MQEISITPVELFFMGGLLNARYIDYSYIAAMPDIQINYETIRQETMKQMEDKGWIEESFDGEVEVSAEVSRLLLPIFFGEIETRLVRSNDVNFHVHDSQIVMAVMQQEGLSVSEVDDDTLTDLFKGEDVRLVLADVRSGYKELSFTAEEMLDGQNIRKAIQFVKGEEE